MPRPPKFRVVETIPRHTYFKPAGIPLKELEEVVLTVEELEALRLKDLELLDQEMCAAKMQISRPTFHRILNGARSKVALALIQGKAIRVSGGNYLLLNNHYYCHDCQQKWKAVSGKKTGGFHCPRCKSRNITPNGS